MNRSSVLGVLVVMTGMAVPAFGQVKLEWKFKEGDKFYQENVTRMKQNTKTTFLGADQNIKNDIAQTSVLSYTVISKTSDATVIDQKFESMKMESGGLLPQAGDYLQKLQGATLRATMNANHQVVKLEGTQELVKKIAGEDPVLRKMFESMIGEETMKKQVEEAFAFLPPKPVIPGDKWDRKSAVPLGPMGTLETIHSFTYVGKETLNGKPVEKIVASAKLSYSPPKGNEGGLPFQINKGEFKADSFNSTIYFDADAGRLVQSEVKMKFKGVLNIVAAGQNGDLTMDQDSTVTVRVTDTNPAAK